MSVLLDVLCNMWRSLERLGHGVKGDRDVVGFEQSQQAPHPHAGSVVELRLWSDVGSQLNERLTSVEGSRSPGTGTIIPGYAISYLNPTLHASTRRSKVMEERLGSFIPQLDTALPALFLPHQRDPFASSLQLTWFMTKLTAILAPLGHLGSGGLLP